jgi:hypothetical protein
MTNGSQRIFDCLMHSFTNCIGLWVLDRHWNLMDAVLDQDQLKGATGEFTTLVKYTPSWTRVTSEPTIIK